MKIEQSIAIMKALADQSRLAIINSLLERRQYVEELANRHALAPSTISFHLKKLEKANLVYKIKRGRSVYCHMNHDTWLEVATYVSGVAQFWQNRLNDLEQYVNNMAEENR